MLIAVLCAGPLIAPYNPVAQNRELTNSPPTPAHWLGTDDFGRDVLSRYLAGASWSIFTGIAGAVVALLFGWTIGGAAGFLGGWTERIAMSLADLFLALPWLYLLIGLRAVLPLSWPGRVVDLVTLLLIACVSWARPARLVRGLTLSLAQKEYVHAARGFGVSEWRIFARHVFPGTLNLLRAQGLILLPRFVLAEVTLSFLGLGSGEPSPSWGGLVLDLKHAYLLPQQWWRVLPALLMLPLFLTCAVAARLATERYAASR